MSKEYIYFDWNVIKAVKEDDEQEKMLEVIEWLKARYYFPFSFAHLCDRQRGEEEKILLDLSFVDDLSDGYMIGVDEVNNQYDIQKQDIKRKYNEVKENRSNIYPNIHVSDELVDDIKNTGFEEYFKNNKDSEKLFLVLMAGLNRFDSNADLYKMYREYMMKKGKEQGCIRGFIDIITKDSLTKEDILYAISLYSDFEPDNELSLCQKMSVAYLLLDFNDNFKDRVNKKNNFTNIYTDSMHVITAKFSKCFVTDDKRVLKKAKFIYQIFNVETEVISSEVFFKKRAKVL